MHCDSAKKDCDKLQRIYEGYKKVKCVKLLTHIIQFETLKMNKEETMHIFSSE